MNPCKPQLRLVTSPDEIAPDVVYAIQSNAVWLPGEVTVHSRPVYLEPHFGTRRSHFTDSGKLAPYPGMTDAELRDFESDFGIPTSFGGVQ